MKPETPYPIYKILSLAVTLDQMGPLYIFPLSLLLTLLNYRH